MLASLDSNKQKHKIRPDAIDAPESDRPAQDEKSTKGRLRQFEARAS
jgi:endonuclease YncB( thermonuclease family)